jgi:hypothetical protein
MMHFQVLSRNKEINPPRIEIIGNRGWMFFSIIFDDPICNMMIPVQDGLKLASQINETYERVFPTPIKVKRKVGRPRKNPIKVKRKVGRPRKNRIN